MEGHTRQQQGRHQSQQRGPLGKADAPYYQLLQQDHRLQEAIGHFRRVSELELQKLLVHGISTQEAINALVEKMRTPPPSGSVAAPFSVGGSPRLPLPHSEGLCGRGNGGDVQLVMDLAGFSEMDALRALVMRQELVHLRKQGLDASRAVEEMTTRLGSGPIGVGRTKRKSESMDYFSVLKKEGHEAKKEGEEDLEEEEEEDDMQVCRKKGRKRLKMDASLDTGLHVQKVAAVPTPLIHPHPSLEPKEEMIELPYKRRITSQFSDIPQKKFKST